MAFIVSAITGSTVAGAIAGSAVIGGIASNRAAGAQERGNRNAIAEQQRQYDQTRADFAPFRQIGYDAASRLSSAASGDMSGFFASPDYNFRRNEGMRDIGGSFAARGGAASGNALEALANFNSNLASGEYGNWWNRQAGLLDAGQGGTAQTAQAGQNAANNISAGYQNIGDARASGIIGTGNAIGGAMNNWLLYRGGYGGGGYGGYGGGTVPGGSSTYRNIYDPLPRIGGP